MTKVIEVANRCIVCDGPMLAVEDDYKNFFRAADTDPLHFRVVCIKGHYGSFDTCVSVEELAEAQEYESLRKWIDRPVA